jgi:hypothetical protein
MDGVRNTPPMLKFLSSVPHLVLGAFGIAVGWSPWRKPEGHPA